MKYSENYGFALPTADDDTLADIGEISKNFKTVDRVMKKNEDLGTELNKFEAETMDAVERLKTKDTNLQYQIDTDKADIAELKAEDNNLQSQIDTAKTDIATLKTTDKNLQSQIDALGGVDMSEIQSQLDTKVDKVEGKGLSTNDYDDSAEEKVLKIGNVSKIPTASRYIVQWIQDVYDSVFTSSADNTCLADKVTAEVASRKSADENLQSQIDTANTDIIEIQESVHNLDIEVDLTKSNLNKVEARMGSWVGSGTLYDMVKVNKTDIATLKTTDKNLQSQLDTKATRKVAVVGSDSYDSDGWYKVASGTISRYQAMSLLFAVHTPAKSGKYSGILQLDLRGGAEAIVTGDEIKLGWLVRTGFDLSQVIITVDGYNWALYYNLRSNQNFRVFFEVIQGSGATNNKAIYNLHIDSAIEETAPLATATSTDLGTVNTANKLTTARNINGIAFDGSKDINITANDIPSTSLPGYNLAYEVGTTIADLNAVEAKIGTWSSGQTISNTISELQKSTLDLDREVTSTQADLNAVKARIGRWGTSKTLYDMIVDLTARIEALENSAS